MPGAQSGVETSRYDELLRQTATDLIELVGIYRALMVELNRHRNDDSYLDEARPVITRILTEIAMTCRFAEDMLGGRYVERMTDPRTGSVLYHEIGDSLALVLSAPDFATLMRRPLLHSRRLDQLLSEEPLLSWLDKNVAR